ncbi:MAG: hypothetical protein MUP58_00110 [Candidatus Nanohaloarchaeota archaeon QJJ-9]|nr:hypothetical protein [Candidatus Nanohaloarchaeota archaeon QJJ-9]
MRKGYLHAVEGVIASLLAVLYLGTIISTPPATDWEKTSLNKRSGDLLGAMSETGVIDYAVLEDDSSIVRGTKNVLGSNLEYSMHISGLPKRDMEISMILPQEDVTRAPSFNDSYINSNWADLGLPPSEDGAGYRSGEIMGIDFVVYDLIENGVADYNGVSFDINRDGDFGDTGIDFEEGPYRARKKIDCRSTFCPDTIIGYIGKSLTLYNTSGEQEYAPGLSGVEIGGIDVETSIIPEEIYPVINVSSSDFSYEDGYWVADRNMQGLNVDFNISDSSGNSTLYINDSEHFRGSFYSGDSVRVAGGIYSIESVMPLHLKPQTRVDSDVLFLERLEPGYIDNHSSTIYSTLSNGGTIIDMSNWTEEDYLGSCMENLGIGWRNFPYSSPGTGSRFYRGEDSPDYIRQSFNSMGIGLNSSLFEEHGSYSIANLTLKGEEFYVNISSGEVSINRTKEFDEWYSQGERLFLAGESYRIQQIQPYPFVLNTGDEYRFKNYPASNFTGETVLTVEKAVWNVEESSYNATGMFEYSGDDSTLPNSKCGNRRVNKSFSVGENTFNVVLTDKEPCGDFDYVNFDFNSNDAYNDSEEDTPAGFGAEGIYRRGEEVVIDGEPYRIELGNEVDSDPSGDWVYLEREVPNHVPAAVWHSGVFNGRGNLFQMPDVKIGDDGMSLLKSVIVRASVERYRFSQSKISGGNAIGLTYAEELDNEVYLPYTIESLWWYGE